MGGYNRIKLRVRRTVETLFPERESMVLLSLPSPPLSPPLPPPLSATYGGVVDTI